MKKLDYINLTQRSKIVGKVFKDYEDLCNILYEDKIEKFTATKKVKDPYLKHKAELLTRIKWKKCEDEEGFIITDYLPLYEYVGESRNIVQYNEVEATKNDKGDFIASKLEPKILYFDDVDFNDFIEAGFSTEDLF